VLTGVVVEKEHSMLCRLQAWMFCLSDTLQQIQYLFSMLEAGK
jgi:hypothetical protein